MESQNLKNNPLNFLSFNARGLGDCTKKSRLFHWLAQHHDVQNKIVFLQETHVTVEKEYKWKEIWQGKMIFSNGNSRSRGVAILFPKDLEYEILKEIKDKEGRYIAVKIEYDGNPYGLINGYAPTSDMLEEQLAWLRQITNIIEELGDTNLIFGGDINEGLSILDKFIGRDKWKESEYVLGWKEVCSEFQLVDIWRMLFPLAHKHTWRQGTCKKNLRRSRLDFWLISTGLIYSVDNAAIKPGYGSDHSLISLSLFKQKQTVQGPSFWKFNTGLLRIKQYTDKVTEDIEKLKVKYVDIEDKGLKWDLIKMELRTGAISFSKFNAKQKRDNIKVLLTKQIELENQIANDPSDNILGEAESIKEQIEEYNSEKARGAWLRSKANWVEYGEKSTNFFLKLENRNRLVKNITALVNEEGSPITGQKEILAEERRYYKELYTQPVDKISENRDEIKNFFLSEDIPEISEEDHILCDAQLSLVEVSKALKDLKNGKTPGTDGLPPDFYKFFWKNIGSLVYDSLKHVWEKGEMSIDQKRGVINLIPKKDKDVRFLKNWRPISLLNTDYKILTKAMAVRLKQVLPTVINPDQVAYLKGRYIGQNIRTIIDIMEYTKDQNIEDRKSVV
jgi:exonuclease III